MTNNYYEKFPEFKNQNYIDIRGVCKFQINEIFDKKIEKKMKIILF